MFTKAIANHVASKRSFQVGALFFAASFLLNGCAASAANLPSAVPVASAPGALPSMVEPLADYAVPKPTPTPTPDPKAKDKQTATINTQGIRANLRSGPGTNNAIVIKADPGEVFELVGKSQDGRWVQVLVPAKRATDGKEQNAWISAELVRQGTGDIPVVASAPISALLTSDLSTNWQVAWTCTSERCALKQCSADVTAKVNRAPTGGYLPVEHTVTWADDCFSTDAWTFDVDAATGKERNNEAAENFLYGYWLGANPGDANGVYPLGDGKQGVVVYCSGPHKVEIEEGGGWTTVYEGNTCHDTKTGMLVYMNYTKRWLFSGDYEGKTYERAYFGDAEKLEQRLVESTANLAYVEKK